MDKQIIEYRKKNKKCKWCKYYTVREDDEKNEISINK